MFHDGFRIDEWLDFFTGFDNVVLDTHLYLMMRTWTDETNLDAYLSYIDDTFAPTLREAASRGPSWSVNGASTRRRRSPPNLARMIAAATTARSRRPSPGMGARGRLVLLELQAQHRGAKARALGHGSGIEARWLPEDLAAPGD